MSAPLPTNRTVASTAAEHVADHAAIHAFFNAVRGMSAAVVTANYTAGTDDYLIIANGTSITVTLPDATTQAGRYFCVKNINATALTLSTLGGNIDGIGSQNITQYNALTVFCDGTNYFII